jgi:hypothetical protein
MRKYGDQLSASEIVTVDGKPISADINELDTDEGWVEIVLPVFESQNTIDREDGVEEEELPLFDYETKRLNGKVEIIDLAARQ